MAKLWVPNTATDEPRQIWRCLTCGREFPHRHREQARRHMIACDRKNPEVAEATLEAIRKSPFRSVPDKEKSRWIRRRVAEGKDVKL